MSSEMIDYNVSFDLDIRAKSPDEAVKIAWGYLMGSGNPSAVVTDPDGESVTAFVHGGGEDL